MKVPQTMQKAPVNRTTKAAVRVASVAAWTMLILGLSVAACSAAKKSTNDPGSSSAPGGGGRFGNGSGTGGRRGGGGLGAQTGGFFVYASVANPPTGAVTTAPAMATAPAADGSTMPAAPTGINEGGFRVECTTDAGAAAQEMILAMKTVKATTGEEFDSQLSFKSTCSDFARITVAQIATGDVATLTVKLATLAGVNYASGVTSAYTQAAPAIAATTANTSGTGGRPNFTPPTATEVAIAMQAVTATTGGTTATGSGTGGSSLIDE